MQQSYPHSEYQEEIRVSLLPVEADVCDTALVEVRMAILQGHVQCAAR